MSFNGTSYLVGKCGRNPTFDPGTSNAEKGIFSQCISLCTRINGV